MCVCARASVCEHNKNNNCLLITFVHLINISFALDTIHLHNKNKPKKKIKQNLTNKMGRFSARYVYFFIRFIYWFKYFMVLLTTCLFVVSFFIVYFILKNLFEAKNKGTIKHLFFLCFYFKLDIILGFLARYKFNLNY